MGSGRIIAGRYRLDEILGEGGQATVYRAVDVHTGRQLAVKVLNGQLSRDPTVVARVVREQQAMVALAGTNAVEFVELCTERDGTLCMVMELLEGRDLESYLTERERAKRPLPIAEMVAIMQPVVDTLDTAHAVGIVHRDLKPGNIFLRSERSGGGSRLLDFGLANLSSSEPLTAVGTVMGSPSYIAPESWSGVPGRSGARADLYSLGVILFRMLGGRMPFAGKSLLEKMRNTTTADRPSLHELRNELPPQVDIWVERALAVDPRDRFASPAACFGELLWSLKLAAHPAEGKRTQLTEEQAQEVRNWVETNGPRPSLPLLSIEPMPMSSENPGGSAVSSDRLPILSLEPEPYSVDSAETNPPAARAKGEKSVHVLPPIPKAPGLPEREISATFAQRTGLSTSLPSVLPERSGVRTNNDWEEEEPTTYYSPPTKTRTDPKRR